MSDSTSHAVNAFHGRALPEPGAPAGYAVLIDQYGLDLPLPARLAAIASRHHPRSTDRWRLLTPRHAPADTLEGHVRFALKWEGVNLAVLSTLFEVVADAEVAAIVRGTPSGAYTRRLWFLHEWLTGRELDVPDPGKVRSVLVVNPDHQFVVQDAALSSRHKVRNNLPGTSAFCPLVRRTPELERYRGMGLDARAREVIGRTHPDIVRRAAAFLLLSDSRSSFRIEGERSSATRASRWGQAIGEAGSLPLSVKELERLQKIIIGDARFVRLGLRTEGSFVGLLDRLTQQPIPDHISARVEDLEDLMRGVAAYAARAVAGDMDPVAAAAAVSFGFVYVHPFEDGNGRLHRWLIHHVLAKAGFNPPGIVFPVSAAILREIDEYRQVLESYSKPLLHCVEWRPTEEGNVEVLNATADYYRYFDATPHAEFLYRCVEETVTRDLPEEVAYLEAYDRFANEGQSIVDMPGSTINLLHRFLSQGGGQLSKRARTGEFAELSDAEIERIERLYAECFS